MFGIPLNWIGAGALIVGGMLFTFWPTIGATLKSAGSGVLRIFGYGTKAAPDRKAALAKCDDCIAFLEAVGCTEGVAHFKAGLVHFYHHHGE